MSGTPATACYCLLLLCGEVRCVSGTPFVPLHHPALVPCGTHREWHVGHGGRGDLAAEDQEKGHTSI